jgi:hypothetical protein
MIRIYIYAKPNLQFFAFQHILVFHLSIGTITSFVFNKDETITGFDFNKEGTITGFVFNKEGTRTGFCLQQGRNNNRFCLQQGRTMHERDTGQCHEETKTNIPNAKKKGETYLLRSHELVGSAEPVKYLICSCIGQ